MRRFLITLSLCCFAVTSVLADGCCECATKSYNPFFGDFRHQVALNIGAGIDSGIIVPLPARFVPFAELHVQYSVPSTLFYFPSRLSLNVTQTIGFGRRYGWDWDDYSIPIIYLTKDVAFAHGRNWYAGMGAGGGFQVAENDRIGSKLVFTLKLFAGYRINERATTEIYVKHFSNGNTAPENNSYAFYGMGMTYNF